MATIKAFKAYRPPADIAEKLASVPYDVINEAEARKMAEGNEHSFLRIIRPEVDLDEGVDVYAQEVYQKAKDNFHLFVENGWLKADDSECIYLYRQIMDTHAQVGIVALTSSTDYWLDVIKKHEYTRPKKEKDRITNVKTTGIHAGPVFQTFKHNHQIDEWMENQLKQLDFVSDFTAEDGVRHTLWMIDDKSDINQLVMLFKTDVPAIYIADGHHRAASGAKVAMEMQNANPNHNGTEDYNFFLSVMFPDSQLKIIDYNRLVKDLNGMTSEEFIEKLSEHFEVRKYDGEGPFRPEFNYEFGMYLDKTWYQMDAKQSAINEDDAIASLDISVLSDFILAPLLGIEDQRRDERIDFVGGIRGLEELERRVDSGDFKLAFSIFPVSIAQLMEVADEGKVMPPKSTWFEPKLRSGLVVNKFK